MSELQTLRIGLNDVYDLAYDIAQEFEKVVLLCDINLLEPVINKVINVLEILETSIQRIERLEAEIRTLKSNNLRLSSEKIVSDQEKTKLKRIYEESEESWSEEVINLNSQLSALKLENELLKNHLAKRKDDTTYKSDDKSSEVIQEQSEIIERLKRMIKQKEIQLQENISTINALNSRVQELLKMNEILHLKNQAARNDISRLIVEKNDAKNELKLHKKENEILNETVQELLQTSPRIQEGDGKALPINSSECILKKTLAEDLNCHQHQELTLQEKIKKLQVELQNLRAKSKQIVSTSKINSNNTEVPLSRIHQLFHLFLGVTTFSGFYWI